MRSLVMIMMPKNRINVAYLCGTLRKRSSSLAECASRSAKAKDSESRPLRKNSSRIEWTPRYERASKLHTAPQVLRYDDLKSGRVS